MKFFFPPWKKTQKKTKKPKNPVQKKKKIKNQKSKIKKIISSPKYLYFFLFIFSLMVSLNHQVTVCTCIIHFSSSSCWRPASGVHQLWWLWVLLLLAHHIFMMSRGSRSWFPLHLLLLCYCCLILLLLSSIVFWCRNLLGWIFRRWRRGTVRYWRGRWRGRRSRIWRWDRWVGSGMGDHSSRRWHSWERG